MSDDIQRLRAWQIKDFPETKRKMVIRAAEDAGQTVAEWLEPVIDRALDLENQINRPVNHPVGPREMAEIAAIAGLPRWVRSGAAKLVGDALGITRPAPPPRRPRLNGPNHRDGQDISHGAPANRDN